MNRYRTITSTYYRGTQGIMVVFDLTNKPSFDNIKRWLVEIENNTGADVAKMLIGNKRDLAEKQGARQVTTEAAKEFADGLKVSFFECSARDNYNVSEAFEVLAKESLKYLVPGPEEKNKNTVRPDQSNGKPNKKCC